MTADRSMQSSRQLNHLPTAVAGSAPPLLPWPDTDKENAVVVPVPERDAIWGFDSELIDPQLKEAAGPESVVLGSILGPARSVPPLGSDLTSSSFTPALHSTPSKHLPILDTSLLPLTASPPSDLSLVAVPSTTTGIPTDSPIITSVPSPGEHPIHHLRRVLYEFNSTFSGQGIICAINTLLNLPLPALTRFYRGEYATPDGKCPFCMTSLK
jgi:hypothetical protein